MLDLLTQVTSYVRMGAAVPVLGEILTIFSARDRHKGRRHEVLPSFLAESWGHFNTDVSRYFQGSSFVCRAAGLMFLTLGVFLPP